MLRTVWCVAGSIVTGPAGPSKVMFRLQRLADRVFLGRAGQLGGHRVEVDPLVLGGGFHADVLGVGVEGADAVGEVGLEILGQLLHVVDGHVHVVQGRRRKRYRT